MSVLNQVLTQDQIAEFEQYETPLLPAVAEEDIIKPRVIALEDELWEQTPWELYPGTAAYGDVIRENLIRIETVWLYDSNSQTHCAEFSGSYALHLVETRAIFKPEFIGTALYENIIDGVDDAVRGDEGEDVTYRHCRDIDRIIETFRDDPFRYAELKDEFRYINSGTTRDEAIEALIEGVNSNAVI